jgi:hypothetical protein
MQEGQRHEFYGRVRGDGRAVFRCPFCWRNHHYNAEGARVGERILRASACPRPIGAGTVEITITHVVEPKARKRVPS